MPNFLVNTDKSVLIDFVNGKEYVSRPGHVFRQSAQKGLTCWFFGMSHIRVRYGKDSKSDMRKYEVALSAFRKQITALDDLFHNHKSISFDTYLNRLLSNSKLALNAMDVPAVRAQRLFVEELNAKCTVDVDMKDLQQREVAYHRAVLAKAREIFKIQAVSWRPDSPFKDFMDKIKQHGKLSINGYFGRPFYAAVEPKTLKKDYHGVEVQFFKGSDYVNPAQGSTDFHNLIVVGASKEPGGKALVYYIDPNDALDPSAARKVYAMSYESMCSRMTNIFDEYKEVSIAGGPMRHYPLALRGPFVLVASPTLEREYLKEKFTIRHFDKDPVDYGCSTFGLVK